MKLLLGIVDRISAAGPTHLLKIKITEESADSLINNKWVSRWCNCE